MMQHVITGQVPDPDLRFWNCVIRGINELCERSLVEHIFTSDDTFLTHITLVFEATPEQLEKFTKIISHYRNAFNQEPITIISGTPRSL